MTRLALSDTLSFCFDIGLSSPAVEMSKYVEADFAFMSVFCLHILTVRKSFANLVVCKPTQAYDWFPLAHLLQKGRSHRPLIKHRLIEKSKLLGYGCFLNGGLKQWQIGVLYVQRALMLSFLSSHCEKTPLKEMLTLCVPESRRGALKEIELPLMEIDFLNNSPH